MNMRIHTIYTVHTGHLCSYPSSAPYDVCVYMYVCMYVYTHTHAHIQADTHNICIHPSIHPSIYTCVNIRKFHIFTVALYIHTNIRYIASSSGHLEDIDPLAVVLKCTRTHVQVRARAHTQCIIRAHTRTPHVHTHVHHNIHTCTSSSGSFKS